MRVATGKEFKAAAAFAQFKLWHYLPFTRVRTTQRGARRMRNVPLLPGYIFMRLNASERLRALQTNFIMSVIYVARPRQLVHELCQLKFATKRNAEFKPVETFVEGDAVKLKSGPFAGMEGVFVRKGRDYGFVLNITIIGKSIEVNVDPRDVAKVNN